MNGKPNILIVVSGLYIGGAEKVAANLCRHIDQDKYNVMVCHLSLPGPIGEILYKEGYNIRPVCDRTLKKTDYFTAFKLRKFIRQHKIDLVHSHDTHAFIDCCMSKLMFAGATVVHTFHFGNYPHQVKKYKRLENLLWRIPDKLVAVGHDQKRRIMQTYGIPEDKITVIPNGVDILESAGTLELSQYRQGNNIIIGSISTLIEQKGITYLIDVAALLKKLRKDFVFLIVGGGHLQGELQLKVEKLALHEHVHFIGWVDNAAQRVLPQFDIFFQPSLWEAMSMVILEAMMAGKAIVATDVGDNSVMITHGKTGFIVKPKDINDMADKLNELIGDEKQRKMLGESARSQAEKMYTSRVMAMNHEKLYTHLLRDKMSK